MKKYYYILLASSFLFTLNSCKQGAKTAEETAEDTTPTTFSFQPSEADADPETAGMTPEERAEFMNTDAPSEGLSQKTYEDLEMPGEIVGGNEVILMKSQFTISYNSSTYCPNYVCWHLTKDRTRGDEQRPDDFIPDGALLPSMQVNTHDYSGSGYDRGHMCPAGDNKNSKQAMLESFNMTNVCPQRHDLNEGDWNELEGLCRSWARNYGELYICCGPIFDSKTPKTIGKRNRDIQISVPDRFFKVVLKMGKRPRAIGFIFPNDATRRDIRSYAVSVDKVEKETGLDFFPNLEDELENRIESECKPADWNI